MIVEDRDGDLQLRVESALVELIAEATGDTDPVSACWVIERLTVRIAARLERLASENPELATEILKRHMQQPRLALR